MKKLLILLSIVCSIAACKKDKEFTKTIHTEGDGAVITLTYNEINTEKIFRGKKIRTDYTVAIQWQNAGAWETVDLSNFAGGQIKKEINGTTGDLTLNFEFAPFGTDQKFKIIITG
jgi:hypothetical protein